MRKCGKKEHKQKQNYNNKNLFFEREAVFTNWNGKKKETQTQQTRRKESNKRTLTSLVYLSNV